MEAHLGVLTASPSIEAKQSRFRRFVRLAARSFPIRLILVWLLFNVIQAPYLALRGIADESGLPVRGDGWERAVFGGRVPSEVLQDWLFEGRLGPLEWLTIALHASFFTVPSAIVIFVVVAKPHRIRSLMAWWMTLIYASVAIWAAVPTRPPWMADPEITRIIALRVEDFVAVDPNQLAAFPSLHVALPLLLGVWLQREGLRVAGAFMYLLSALIGLAAVYGGEHYVIDIAAAVVLVSVVAAIADAIEERVASAHSKSAGALARLVRSRRWLETTTAAPPTRGTRDEAGTNT